MRFFLVKLGGWMKKKVKFDCKYHQLATFTTMMCNKTSSKHLSVCHLSSGRLGFAGLSSGQV
jgi:hypothetical protein